MVERSSNSICVWQVQGLCGIYNLRQTDDFTLPSGATTVDAAEFGNSWKTNSLCSVNEAATGRAVDACLLASEYAQTATETCAQLKSGGWWRRRLKLEES